MSPFSPMPAAEFFTTTPDKHEWIWQDYLTGGSLTALAGYAKTGKSTFAAALARSVMHGKQFLGRPTTQGPVLFLALEEHPVGVKRRFLRFGITSNDPFSIWTKPITPDDLPSIAGYVNTKGVRLVLLDTITKYYPAAGVENENNNQEVQKALEPWLAAARSTSAAWVLVAHTSKSNKSGASVRGASAADGLADQIITLAGQDGSPERTIHARGRFEETPASLKIRLVGADYEVVSSPAPKETSEAKILAYLNAQPGKQAQTGAIVDGAGVSQTRFHAAMKKLHERHLVEQPKHGWWALTAKGELAVMPATSHDVVTTPDDS